MQFRELFPFLMPGIILQLFVQGFYVHHCINNKDLTKASRLKYALSIAIFTLPAAAIYLLKESKNKQEADSQQGVFDSNVRQAIFVLLVVAFEINAVRVIVNYIGEPQFNSLVWLFAIGLVLMIVTELTIQFKKIKVAYGLSLMLIGVAFVVQYIVYDFNSQFLVIIVLASIINNYPLIQAKRFAYVTLSGFVLISISRPYLVEPSPDFEEVISSVYLSFIIFGLVVASFYMLKKLYITNHDLSKTMKLIEAQNMMIEELSAAQERNKIAKEIHDTVGHRLTGALLSIEAADILQDQQQRSDKLNTARNLIKDALGDIRNSVKLLVEDNFQNFNEKVNQLVADIRKNTHLTIDVVIEIQSPVLSIHQHVLLRAIMECATNTLKHSQSNKADVLIQESNDVLFLSFNDNGRNVQPFTFGFGLNTMKNSVESLGGLLQASSEDDGFQVSIKLPIGKILKGVHHE